MTMASGLHIEAFRTATSTTPTVLNLLLNTNKVDLYLDAKTPNFDTDSSYSATNEVATATGYTRDNKTVGGTPTWAYTSAHRLAYGWSTTVSWTSATFTARGMILHTAADDLPFCGVTFGADYTATNGTFTITQNAAGIYYITMA